MTHVYGGKSITQCRNAAERGFGVLHYDRNFDTLATVLAFTSQWVAPAGSID